MARVLGILLALIMTSSLTLAQQSDQKSPSVLVIGQRNDSTKPFSTSQTFRLTNPFNRIDPTLHLGQVGRPLFAVDPIFIVRDGEVRLSLFQDSLLVSMPGGGASGCFNLDLQERIEKLRKSLQMFPPLHSKP